MFTLVCNALFLCLGCLFSDIIFGNYESIFFIVLCFYWFFCFLVFGFLGGFEIVLLCFIL